MHLRLQETAHLIGMMYSSITYYFLKQFNKKKAAFYLSVFSLLKRIMTHAMNCFKHCMTFKHLLSSSLSTLIQVHPHFSSRRWFQFKCD